MGRVGWHLEPSGAEQAVLWGEPARGQRGRQGLLRVQGRREGGAALSKDGRWMARLFLFFLKPVGSHVLGTSESSLHVCLKPWRRCSVRTGLKIYSELYSSGVPCPGHGLWSIDTVEHCGALTCSSPVCPSPLGSYQWSSVVSPRCAF